MDLDARLQECIQKLEGLKAKQSRLTGLLSAAESQLADIDAECAKRGLDPTRLDDTCVKLEQQYSGKVAALEKEIAACHKQLAQYEDGDQNGTSG